MSIRRILATAAVALTLGTVSIATAPAAAADPQIIGGGSTSGSPSAPSTGTPGGGSAGGGGGAVSPPPPDHLQYGTVSWPEGVTSDGLARPGTCNVLPMPDGRRPLGYRYERTLTSRDGEWNEAPASVKVLGCIYGPSPRITRVQCAWDGSVVISGPFRNPTRPASRPITSAGADAPFKRAQAIANCPMRVDFSASASLSEFGQYRLDVVSRRVTCTITDYDGQTDTIGNCSAPFRVGASEVKAQVWCGGFSYDWAGSHSFDLTECGPDGPGPKRWSCEVPGGQPTFEGLPGGMAEVMSDGRNRTASWADPVFNGLSIIAVSESRLHYLAGTPYRDGRTPTDYRQPFAVSPEIEKWVGGLNTQWDINWRMASLPDQRWSGAPQWRFTGSITIETLRVTGIDSNGAVIWGMGPQTVSAAGICQGPAVNVLALANRTNN